MASKETRLTQRASTFSATPRISNPRAMCVTAVQSPFQQSAVAVPLPEKVSVVPSLSSSALTASAAKAAGTSASIRLSTSRMLRSFFLIPFLLFQQSGY